MFFLQRISSLGKIKKMMAGIDVANEKMLDDEAEEAEEDEEDEEDEEEDEERSK